MANQSNELITPSPKSRARWTRRAFLLFLGAAVAYLIMRPKRPPMMQSKKRFIILGFDGAEPKLIEKYWDELPNLQALAKQGTWSRLKSTSPPESPVAWSSFAIGANPGKHGVYDFLRRPSGSYIPTEESFVGRQLPRFIFDSIPIRMPKAINQRGGVAFWDVLSDHGLPTTLLEVPCTFPPPRLNYGHTLSGLGVPDARGMQATFHHFIHEPDDDAASLQETTFGGKVERLKKVSDTFVGEIWGPYDPIITQHKNDKEKELLLAGLEWTEWNAHLISMQGGGDAQPSSMEATREFFGKHVIQPFSLFTYLRDDDLRPRIDALRGFFEAGRPFVKQSGATAPEARQAIDDALKKWRSLDSEIDGLSKPIKVPVRIKATGGGAEISAGGQTQTVALNEWSDWFSITFEITSLIAVHAICRFIPLELGERISVFMTSPDIDPRKPPVPISHPGGFSKQLVDWTGALFKTRGWAAETHGLKDGHLSEEGFVSDLLDLMAMREKKTFETFRRTRNNVFVSVFSETDRVSHMYMRYEDEGHPLYNAEEAAKYGGAVKTIWKRMDAIVGRMMKEIEEDPDAVLIVMSDHGFQSWRYQVNLNTWLWKNGYITLKGESPLDGDMKLEDLLKKDANSFFHAVDWAKTKAYALGLGQVYINLKGREPIGSVDAADYDALCREICDGLLALRDERPGRNGVNAITTAQTRGEIWSGEYADDEHDCPDIQVGFNEHYRVSWQTCLGGFSAEIIEDNLEKWSGDHCSFASEHVPGVFFCNRQITIDSPAIFDMAPTVLKYFNLPVPSAMEGRNLFS
ncbi:MAG: hypothetical protein GC154_19120 [bacterium]|nr:hypothetical protein [bacterium]